MSFERRTILLGTATSLALPVQSAFATAPAQALIRVNIRRSLGCGCCQHWADRVASTQRFSVVVVDEPDVAAYRRGLGVPDDLASCHTAQARGFVFEGHVPPEDMLRLISAPDPQILGLAVPDMPMGSPGMEMANGARDAFDVIAFHRDGSRSVFAHYEGSRT